MSALSDRGYGLSRARALILAQPGAFLLSILLSALALAVPMFVALIGVMALPWLDANQPRPEIAVVLAPGLSAREVETVKGALSALDDVHSVNWIARDQALADLAKRYGLGAGEGRPNPLPDVLVARFRTGADADQIARHAIAIKGLAGIASVRTDLDWYRRFLSIARLGVGLLACLAALALLLVLLVVFVAVRGQTVFRAIEFRVLRLLGATPAFIARPYVYLAAISLTLATLLAVAAATVGLALVRPPLEALLGQDGAPRLPPVWLVGALAAFAWMLGAVIGRLAIRGTIRRQGVGRRASS
jgi:cell division transport system permease protein